MEGKAYGQIAYQRMNLFLFHFHAFQTLTKNKFSVKFPLASSKHFHLQKEAMFGSKDVDSLEI
jgi:hypothetical protein